MKNLIKIFFGLLICFLVACETTETQEGGNTSSPDTTEQPSASPSTISPKTVPGAEANTQTLTAKSASSDALNNPKKNDCTAMGEMLEDNDLWIPEEDVWICMVADSVSKDNLDFGDSHRVLDVYDTKTCKHIRRDILPVNRSPDFPYYLYKGTYEGKNKVVCTAGFEYTFCYDVGNNHLFPKMKPRFMKKRRGEDAQSGMPLALGIRGNYLFGVAQDFGTYAFDIKNKTAPKSLLPVAEFVSPQTIFGFNALYFIEESKDLYQAIVPVMDEEEEVMVFKELFERPLKIHPAVAKNVRNNRYLIINNYETDDEKIAIDMKKAEQVILPKEIVTKLNGEILKWLKKRR